MNQQGQQIYHSRTVIQTFRMNNGVVEIITSENIENPESQSGTTNIRDLLNDFLNDDIPDINMDQVPFMNNINELIEQMSSNMESGDFLNSISSFTNINNIINDMDISQNDNLPQEDVESESSEEEAQQEIIEREQDCYICFEQQKQFVNTCGDDQHQICQDCYKKLNKLSGCPSCRNDLQGVVGKQAIQKYFEDTNQSIYIDLYDILLKQHQMQYSGFFNYYLNQHFGNIDDFEQFMEKLISRTNTVVSQICNSTDENTKQYIKLIQFLMKPTQKKNDKYIEKTNEFAKLLLYYF